MATLFARHKVADYAAWRKVYDELDPARKAAGCTGDGVFRGDEDPSDITVYHEFDSMDKAKAFAGSSELREAMEKAGVHGAPDIWFANHT